MDAFDYVIVGGGSAGCVLAARLSEDRSVSVCLLEAGGEGPRSLIDTPLGMVLTVPWPFINWGFKTVPQKELNGRRLYQPRGRVLGGSSAINAQIYTRGQPSDYDAWADMGCRGWAYRDVLPWFRRSEANAQLHDEFHGNEGPLPVSDSATDNPMDPVFLKAAVEAGFRENGDFNGAEQEGVGIYQMTQRGGERWSVARAYLETARARPNLTVLTGTRATRVRFEGLRAVGVDYRRGGENGSVAARAEVLLAAGAFQSPQLLQLSGVGNGEALQRLGIATLKHLPGVGENLQDHLDYTFICKARGTDFLGGSPQGMFRLLKELARYRRERRGMFTSNVAEAGGFLKSDPALAAPDLQLHFCTAIVHNHGRTWRHLFHGYSLHVCDLKSKSRGQVTLAGPDPLAAPAIDPRYLSAPEDMETLVKGYRLARRIIRAEAFAPWRTRELFTAKAETDAEIRALIRERAETIYHPAGTCRMGTGPGAVVDPELRVHGLAALRVVDASVMPTLVAGNTNAPTVMIAERAADFIRRG
ncbi:MAG: GMC family oxidoreductase [Bacillota bacterium]